MEWSVDWNITHDEDPDSREEDVLASSDDASDSTAASTVSSHSDVSTSSDRPRLQRHRRRRGFTSSSDSDGSAESSDSSDESDKESQSTSSAPTIARPPQRRLSCLSANPIAYHRPDTIPRAAMDAPQRLSQMPSFSRTWGKDLEDFLSVEEGFVISDEGTSRESRLTSGAQASQSVLHNRAKRCNIVPYSGAAGLKDPLGVNTNGKDKPELILKRHKNTQRTVAEKRRNRYLNSGEGASVSSGSDDNDEDESDDLVRDNAYWYRGVARAAHKPYQAPGSEETRHEREQRLEQEWKRNKKLGKLNLPEHPMPELENDQQRYFRLPDY